MIYNYLKIALRSTLKNKSHVLINVIGLGIALAFSITIYLLFAFNFEFDDYFKDTSDIYRIHLSKASENGEIIHHEVAPIPMGPLMDQEIAGIDQWTRYVLWGQTLIYDQTSFNQQIAFADSSFFRMFHFDTEYGVSPGYVGKNQIYLSKKTAERYFGKEDPTGQVMQLKLNDQKSENFIVAAVFNEIPPNTTFYFDAVVHFDYFIEGQNLDPAAWTHWIQPGLYLKLNPGTDPTHIAEQLVKYRKIYNEKRPEWQIRDYELVAFKDSHKLNQSRVDYGYVNFRLSNEVLIVFSTMAILILLIACFNLANSSMAMMSKRVREIGMRKVMGGSSGQIFIQFLFEMFIISMMSILLAIVIANYLAPEFWSLWGLPFSLSDVLPLYLILSMILMMIFVSIIAGLYPAIYSRSFQPVRILNKTVRLKGTNAFTRILLTLQFAISILVLVAGFVFTRNAAFLDKLSLGYNRKSIIYISIGDEKDYNLYWDAIHQNPDIQQIAGLRQHIGFGGDVTYINLDTGKVEIWDYGVGNNYLETMGVKLLDGRLPDNNHALDFTDNIVVNKTFAEQFMKDGGPGTIIRTRDGRKYVIGVIDNFIENIYKGAPERPLIFHLIKPAEYHGMIVKADPANISSVKDYLEKEWKKNIPYKPFNGVTQDEVVIGSSTNNTNSNLKKTFFFLAILGGIMSLAGIYSLASLNTAKRTKEISIRKILGAPVQDILLLINREFIIILGIAALIGSAAGFFLTTAVLELIYEFHVAVGMIPLIIASLVIILVALFTTTSTIFKTANTNPAYILRND